MQRRIYLLRHGDVSYFSSDGQPVSFQHATLNDHGIAQAIALGEILAPIAFQKYIFSGLLRSHQTMDLVVGNGRLVVLLIFKRSQILVKFSPVQFILFLVLILITGKITFYQPLARDLTLILVLWVEKLFLISPIVSTALFVICLKILLGKTP